MASRSARSRWPTSCPDGFEPTCPGPSPSHRVPKRSWRRSRPGTRPARHMMDDVSRHPARSQSKLVLVQRVIRAGRSQADLSPRRDPSARSWASACPNRSSSAGRSWRNGPRSSPPARSTPTRKSGDPRRFPQRRLLRTAGLHPGGRQPQALHRLPREARPGQRQVRRRRARRVRRRRRSATSRPSRGRGRRTRSTARSPAGRSRRSTRRSTTRSTSAATGSSSRTSARPASITRGRTSRPTSGSTPRPWPSDERQLKKFVFLLHANRMVPLHGPCHLDALLQESEKVGRELTKEVYAEYAFIRQSTLSRLRWANPEVEPRLILGCAQKLLDRILFIAFCEDRGLLPPETHQAGVRPPRPVQPPPALGQLPRDVPRDQRRQRRRWTSASTTAACSPTTRSSTA